MSGPIVHQQDSVDPESLAVIALGDEVVVSGGGGEHLADPADGDLVGFVGEQTGREVSLNVQDVDGGIVAHGGEDGHIHVGIIVAAQAVAQSGGGTGQLGVLDDAAEGAAAAALNGQGAAAEVDVAAAGQTDDGLAVGVQLEGGPGGNVEGGARRQGVGDRADREGAGIEGHRPAGTGIVPANGHGMGAALDQGARDIKRGGDAGVAVEVLAIERSGITTDGEGAGKIEHLGGATLRATHTQGGDGVAEAYEVELRATIHNYRRAGGEDVIDEQREVAGIDGGETGISIDAAEGTARQRRFWSGRPCRRRRRC